MPLLNTALIAWTLLGLPALLAISKHNYDWRQRQYFWHHMAKYAITWTLGPLMLCVVGVMKE